MVIGIGNMTHKQGIWATIIAQHESARIRNKTACSSKLPHKCKYYASIDFAAFARYVVKVRCSEGCKKWTIWASELRVDCLTVIRHSYQKWTNSVRYSPDLPQQERASQDTYQVQDSPKETKDKKRTDVKETKAPVSTSDAAPASPSFYPPYSPCRRQLTGSGLQDHQSCNFGWDLLLVRYV